MGPITNVHVIYSELSMFENCGSKLNKPGGLVTNLICNILTMTYWFLIVVWIIMDILSILIHQCYGRIGIITLFCKFLEQCMVGYTSYEMVVADCPNFYESLGNFFIYFILVWFIISCKSISIYGYKYIYIHIYIYIYIYFASLNTILFILPTYFTTHSTSQFLFLHTIK